MPAVTVSQALALAQQRFEAGRFAEAENLYRQILAVTPQHAGALNSLGIIAAQTGRHDLAVELMRQSIALEPRNSAYHDNLGTVLRDLGRIDEAIACSRQALALNPNEPITHHNLGNALQDKGLLTEAIRSYERALQLAPKYAAPHLGLGRAFLDLGRTREGAAAYRRAHELDPNSPGAHSALLSSLHYLEDATPKSIFAEHRRWNEIHATSLTGTIEPHPNDPAPGRRLRIGYVSPDFREHPVAFFMESLLASHDRTAVEVFCYANVHRSDAVTARLRQHAEHWRDIFPLTDAQAAALIREDRIDILIDLAGHTADHRLLVFARKPAPVQVTYLGYCDTTGLETMDYRLTDTHCNPLGVDEETFTERLIRLPEPFACYRPPADAPPVEPPPALHNGHVTFASFHTLAKLNAPLLAWWAKIMSRSPSARLLFAAAGLWDPSARTRLQDFFRERGITTERLEFRGWQTFGEYLAMHRQVDVLLDSQPFSGHTVSCHALWMGVPVVTLAGARSCSRMVTSVLRNAGCSDLIAETPEEYVRIVCNLAADLPRLAALRATLRERLTSSPVTDGPRFACAVEAAYREMWRTWCAKRR